MASFVKLQQQQQTSTPINFSQTNKKTSFSNEATDDQTTHV